MQQDSAIADLARGGCLVPGDIITHSCSRESHRRETHIMIRTKAAFTSKRMKRHMRDNLPILREHYWNALQLENYIQIRSVSA